MVHAAIAHGVGICSAVVVVRSSDDAFARCSISAEDAMPRSADGECVVVAASESDGFVAPVAVIGRR
jgi:hypothetical protein